jgi:hypothetical protein
MVDYQPWKGNYAGTIAHNNTIIGGSTSQTGGANEEDVIIKSVISLRECHHF